MGGGEGNNTDESLVFLELICCLRKADNKQTSAVKFYQAGKGDTDAGSGECNFYTIVKEYLPEKMTSE